MMTFVNLFYKLGTVDRSIALIYILGMYSAFLSFGCDSYRHYIPRLKGASALSTPLHVSLAGQAEPGQVHWRAVTLTIIAIFIFVLPVGVGSIT